MLAESARSTSARDRRTDVTPRRRALAHGTETGDVPPADDRVIGVAMPPAQALPRLEVAGGRSFEHSPVRGEPGAMQRAIPGLLEVVEPHNAAEVGTD